jgi:hypothetical protein
MATEWHHLTDLTGDKGFVVTGARLVETGVEINGEFELPPLAALAYEDQVFVGEFVRQHGSLKAMERAFGISYPTVKNRLNRIAERLQLVVIETTPDRDEILDQLESGDITAEEAAERLER